MKPLSELGISPTPWKIGEGYLGKWIEDANGVEIVDTGLKDDAQCRANANLFYAAPYLYDALFDVAKYLGLNNGCEIGKLGVKIIAALARANGEGEVGK